MDYLIKSGNDGIAEKLDSITISILSKTMTDKDEAQAWKNLKEDKDIDSWLKWGEPHWSDADITRAIYAVFIIAIGLGVLFFFL